MLESQSSLAHATVVRSGKVLL